MKQLAIDDKETILAESNSIKGLVRKMEKIGKMPDEYIITPKFEKGEIYIFKYAS